MMHKIPCPDVVMVHRELEIKKSESQAKRSLRNCNISGKGEKSLKSRKPNPHDSDKLDEESMYMATFSYQTS